MASTFDVAEPVKHRQGALEGLNADLFGLQATVLPVEVGQPVECWAVMIKAVLLIEGRTCNVC